MRSQPWAVLLTVFVVTTVLLVARQGAGLTGPALLVAAISAFATCAGAVVAPATFGAPPPSPREHRNRKAAQLVAAGFVTSLLTWLGLMTPPVAAILGIAAALGVGAVLPRENADRDDAPTG